jgi:hypothetical protein
MGKNKIESSLELLRIMATKFSEEVTKLKEVKQEINKHDTKRKINRVSK